MPGKTSPLPWPLLRESVPAHPWLPSFQALRLRPHYGAALAADSAAFPAGGRLPTADFVWFALLRASRRCPRGCLVAGIRAVSQMGVRRSQGGTHRGQLDSLAQELRCPVRGGHRPHHGWCLLVLRGPLASAEAAAVPLTGGGPVNRRRPPAAAQWVTMVPLTAVVPLTGAGPVNSARGRVIGQGPCGHRRCAQRPCGHRRCAQRPCGYGVCGRRVRGRRFGGGWLAGRAPPVPAAVAALAAASVIAVVTVAAVLALGGTPHHQAAASGPPASSPAPETSASRSAAPSASPSPRPSASTSASGGPARRQRRLPVRQFRPAFRLASRQAGRSRMSAIMSTSAIRPTAAFSC